MAEEPKCMPMVVSRPGVGTLRAIGKVTGTHYEITRQGVWVWPEDLPGLLAERRPVCYKTHLPVKCFYALGATMENCVPFCHWPGPTVTSEAEEQTEDNTEWPIIDATLPEEAAGAVPETDTAPDREAEAGAPRGERRSKRKRS